MIEFHFFVCSCPDLPTPFVEEAIFTSFYASPPFVKYELTIENLFYFCVWCKLVIEFHFFACGFPDLPTPFVEEAIFTPFYASSPFVEY